MTILTTLVTTPSNLSDSAVFGVSFLVILILLNLALLVKIWLRLRQANRIIKSLKSTQREYERKVSQYNELISKERTWQKAHQ